MPAHDTISDMLTRIRNACAVRHLTVNIPSTRMTRSIADVLIEEGFINTSAMKKREKESRKT